MFDKLALADKCGFAQRCRFLMMVGRQDGYWMRVPWGDFTFGREYTANKSVDRRHAEEHVDG